MPYAVVNFVRIEDAEAADRATNEVVLPRLRGLPGFAQATFLANEDGTRGFSVMVFESEEQAQTMADRLGSGQVPNPPGLAFEHQEVWRVVATG
ncbi:MAG TPA: hypothetical protein VE991_11710 [Acidimicrobiales bacterium]|nr:hypothetical protein [Acidimicrobiales bacterium]